MLPCKNKLFNKFLLVSFVFFIVSITINIIVLFTAVTLPESKARAKEVNTSKIHVQQEKILERLDRVESRIKKNKHRRIKNRVK